MRLTLRTLLAWRDGLLEAPEREELSTKIGERGLARSLLERIEAVSCRSELGVPKLDGRGLAADANSVAAYLENTLEPEKLEAFERICLESDVHLAEVAECHAVLAESTARAPADGNSRTTLLPLIRQKLIESAERESGRHVIQAGKSETPGPRTPPAPRRRPSEVVVAEQAEPLAAQRDRKRRRISPWMQLVLAAGLLVLSGGGLAVVLWRTSGGGRPLGETTAADRAAIPHRQVSEDAQTLTPAASIPEQHDPPLRGNPTDPPSAVAAEAAALASQRPPQPEVSAPGTGNGASNGSPSADSDSGDPDAGRLATREPPPPTAPDPPHAADPGVPLASAARVPMGDALAIAASPAPGPEALLPPVMAPEPPEVAPEGGDSRDEGTRMATGGLVSKGPLVLLADDGVEGGWRARLPGEPLPSESRLLAAPACFPEIDIDGIVVRLQPQSQVVVRSRPRDAGARGRPGEASARRDGAGGGQPSGLELEVVFGRAVIRRRSGDAPCLIAAGPLRWDVAVSGGDAVAVEVALVRAQGTDPLTEASELWASFIPLGGDLAFAMAAGGDALPGLPGEGVVPRGSAARWSSRSPEELVVGEAASPDWVDRVADPDRLSGEAADSFAERAREVGSVVAAARAMATDGRIESREVAAGTLALIGEYADAVAVLCDESVGRRPGERRWRQFEAAVIPLALARGMHSAKRLEQAFATAAPAGAGEPMFRMAVGFTGDQLASGEAARLVAALADERLGMRRYAALRLEEVVQAGPRDASRYRADAAEELRAEGVRWWQVQLEKGLIRPPETVQLSGRDDG